jgi:hypothetical protein
MTALREYPILVSLIYKRYLTKIRISKLAYLNDGMNLDIDRAFLIKK